MKIRFKKLNPAAVTPKQGKPGDTMPERTEVPLVFAAMLVCPDCADKD